MTLIIQKPTGGKLVMRKGWQPMDSDAATYIAAVEAADGQALEEKTKIAIDNFVLGCKVDGIWNAIKASCILAGARTLAGALVPLVGAAPTNFNFVAGDYNRKTGLAGDGSTKYLDSNRNDSVEPLNSRHVSVYKTQGSNTGSLITASNINFDRMTVIDVFGGAFRFGAATGVRALPFLVQAASINFFGVSRSISSSFNARANETSGTIQEASIGLSNTNYFVFNRPLSANYSNSRLAFYSIGESLDLALLDTRVTTLINAIGAAIP